MFTICQGHALPDCNPLVRHWERRYSRTKTSHYDILSPPLSRTSTTMRPRSKACEGLKHCRQLSRVFLRRSRRECNAKWRHVGFSFRCYVVVSRAFAVTSGRRAPRRPGSHPHFGRRADVNEHSNHLKTWLLSTTPIALSSRTGAKRRRRTFVRRDTRRREKETVEQAVIIRKNRRRRCSCYNAIPLHDRNSKEKTNSEMILMVLMSIRFCCG